MTVSCNAPQSTPRKRKTQAKALPPLSKAEIARRLKVTRTHVSLVLNGHRKSKRLLARIQELHQREVAI